MATKKVKISELPQLPESADTAGVYAVGADTDNKTYRVPLKRLDQTDAIKAITSADGMSALINQLPTGTDWPRDDDYFISQYAGGGIINKNYYRRKMSALWGYIKSKVDTVLDITSDNPVQNKAVASALNRKVNMDEVGIFPANIPRFHRFPTHGELVEMGYNTEENRINNYHYFLGLLKYLQAEHKERDDKLYIGVSAPNALAFTFLCVYHTLPEDHGRDLPNYALGMYFMANDLYFFGTQNFQYFHRYANTNSASAASVSSAEANASGLVESDS